jgi:tRNA(Ile)-lysidine synthase
MSQLDSDRVLSPWMDSIVNAPQILLGLSGGLDSSLLLHLLCQRIDPALITAVHINHGLSANADHWQQSMANVCKKLGVNFYTKTVQVKNTGQGVEAAAREQRYAVFEKLIVPEGLLFLAHHADDQAETVLYRLLRGSGPKGLSAMSSCRPIASGWLIRPLLAWSKSHLVAAAEQLDITWVEDESNQEDSFDRNYLRNRVLPVIAQRWPDYSRSLQKAAELSRDSEQLAIDMARHDLSDLAQREEHGGISIDLEKFRTLTALRQKNILRHWLLQGQPILPTSKIIDEILQTVVDARDDAVPQVTWQSVCWRRYQGRLYLLSAQTKDFDLQQQLKWPMHGPITLADNSVLHCQKVTGHGLRVDTGPVEIRYRQGGERCKPSDRAHSNSLKKLLQEFALPPWLRDRVPLLYVNNTLVAVADLWVCEGWSAQREEPGIKITWHVQRV